MVRNVAILIRLGPSNAVSGRSESEEVAAVTPQVAGIAQRGRGLSFGRVHQRIT